MDSDLIIFSGEDKANSTLKIVHEAKIAGTLAILSQRDVSRDNGCRILK